ncbi:MAG: hypothetical protein KDI33_09080 [Halioglobus sp.]|nr:hypothetical protein [Halioglobus sp.]
MTNIIKVIALAAVIGLVTGCKIAVVVPEGGSVQWSDGVCANYYSQDSGFVCVSQVTDTNYSDTFTAIPRDGWQFVKWSGGPNFLCPESTNPTCFVSNVGSAGNAAIEAVIASNKTYYLMPVYVRKASPAPIPATVTVAGREWAQPVLFKEVTRSEIAAACPDGVCSGTLNGYRMDGWTWASSDDLNALFNHYIGSELLGPGPDAKNTLDIQWHDLFWSDGWWHTSTVNSHLAIAGYTRGCSMFVETGMQHPDVGEFHISQNSDVPSTWRSWSLESRVRTIGPFSNGVVDCDTAVSGIHGVVGGWFYRPLP